MDPIQMIYNLRDEAGRNDVRNYRKPPIRFRASEVANCSRQIWYRLSGYIPAPRYGRSDDYGIDGDAHHDITRQLLAHYGVKLRGLEFNEDGTQVETNFLAKEYNVDGLNVTVASRCDGEIFLEEITDWALLEIKSAGYWKFKYLNDAFIEGGREGAINYMKEKRRPYYEQSTITADMHGNGHIYLLLKDRSDCGLGLYNPDTNEHTGLLYPVDQDDLTTILRKLANIKRKVMDGTPPMPEHIASSSDCKYCPFKYLCHDATRRARQKQEPAIRYPDPKVQINHVVATEDASNETADTK